MPHDQYETCYAFFRSEGLSWEFAQGDSWVWAEGCSEEGAMKGLD